MTTIQVAVEIAEEKAELEAVAVKGEEAAAEEEKRVAAEAAKKKKMTEADVGEDDCP